MSLLLVVVLDVSSYQYLGGVNDPCVPSTAVSCLEMARLTYSHGKSFDEGCAIIHGWRRRDEPCHGRVAHDIPQV